MKTKREATRNTFYISEVRYVIFCFSRVVRAVGYGTFRRRADNERSASPSLAGCWAGPGRAKQRAD